MREFSRREFYDLVWSKPMTTLAKKFGLSDVALHKTCKRHKIPTPGLGYWAKVAAGKPAKKTAFQEIDDNSLNTVRIEPSSYNSLPPEVRAAKERAQAEQKNKNKIPQANPPTIDQLSPFVERLKNKLETPQLQKKEQLELHEPKFFSISVAQASKTRLLNFLDALVKEAGSKGYKIEQGQALQFKVDEEEIPFHILEKTDRRSHVPTEKELAALRKWEDKYKHKRMHNDWIIDWDKPQIPEIDFVFNGQFIFEITSGVYSSHGIRRKFSDGIHHRLEKMIPNIIIALATHSAAIKFARAESERQEKEWEEHRRVEKIRRKEEKLEEKRIEALERVLGKWRKVAEVRHFIKAVEKRLKESELVDPNDMSKVEDWLKWSRDYAERIDPLSEGVPNLIQEEDCNSWDFY